MKTLTFKKKIFFILLAFIMYAFFGFSFVVGKKTLEYGGPFLMTGIRMVLAGIVLFLIQVLINRKKITSIKGFIPELILLSVFNIFLTNVLEFWALQFLACYKTCFVYSLSPFISAVLSYFALKEKLGVYKIVGLVIAFCGFAPLLVYKELSDHNKFYIEPAEWALLGAVFATVTGWIVMRKLVHQKKFPVLLANSYSMLLGGVFSFLTSWVFEGFSPMCVSNWKLFVSGLLVITLVNNLIGYNLYAYLTKKFTVTLMTFIGFVTPLLTALFGWLFLKEKITVFFVISYAVVLVGFIFFSKEEIESKSK
ncbi:MAG: S-adenosylmethionine/S-adenosylhomocysteine transporter [Chlamydiae bacterium]|nr:S-adenosylmethionine/S-adenosylhomocysteine transporter [Chlamydiota bacterium]